VEGAGGDADYAFFSGEGFLVVVMVAMAWIKGMDRELWDRWVWGCVGWEEFGILLLMIIGGVFLWCLASSVFLLSAWNSNVSIDCL
jgi:hypothetical protein